MVVLGGWAFSCDRGTPVAETRDSRIPVAYVDIHAMFSRTWSRKSSTPPPAFAPAATCGSSPEAVGAGFAKHSPFLRVRYHRLEPRGGMFPRGLVLRSVMSASLILLEDNRVFMLAVYWLHLYSSDTGDFEKQ